MFAGRLGLGILVCYHSLSCYPVCQFTHDLFVFPPFFCCSPALFLPADARALMRSREISLDSLPVVLLLRISDHPPRYSTPQSLTANSLLTQENKASASPYSQRLSHTVLIYPLAEAKEELLDEKWQARQQSFILDLADALQAPSREYKFARFQFFHFSVIVLIFSVCKQLVTASGKSRTKNIWLPCWHKQKRCFSSVFIS